MTRNTDRSGRTRRSILKTAAGLAGAATILPFSVGAAGATETVDGALDPGSTDLQEVLVVFETNPQVDRLRHLDLADGYYRFKQLPIGFTRLTGSQIETVSGWAEVRYVQANREIEYFNDDARDVTGVETVQEDLFYTGESVHTVVIDSGVDGDHPDLAANLDGHYRFVHPLEEETMWVDAHTADTASGGHGTHCAGTIAGTGEESEGRYKGMSPDATLTVYSTDAAAAFLNVAGAWDDLLDKHRKGIHDVQVVNNSYGASVGGDYNPNGAIQVATWEAFEEGILPVFAAGNSGPNTNTLSDLAAAPHLLTAAASDDDMNVTDFSSRGRHPDYDGGGEGAHWDRQAAYQNLRAFYDADFDSEPVVGERSFSGTVGPGSSDAGVGEGAYHEWTVPDSAGYVEGTVGWTPQGEDIDVYLHEGSRDGPVVASGASLQNPEHLAGQVEGGLTYYLEIRPYLNVTAAYEATLTAREAPDSDPTGPYGVYRPAAAAPGELVMSTLSENDAYQGYPTAIALNPEAQGTEVWYGRLSGTSMACPVLTGIATLVYDAHYQNHGEFPDPHDALLTIEATANDARTGHNAWNAGSGFADATTAVERAAAGDLATWTDVSLAVEGEVTEPVFHATGSRSDDGSVFTAGQTNQVTITLDTATETARIRDEIPFDWTVVGGDDHVVYTDDGHRYVEFAESVTASGSRSYFIEAPSDLTKTGSYEFGPAEAATADGAGAWLTITGTETNEVVAEET